MLVCWLLKACDMAILTELALWILEVTLLGRLS